MTTQELAHAASHIAGGMVSSVYRHEESLTKEAMNEIARLSVQLARRIEEEARNPHPERSART